MDRLPAFSMVAGATSDQVLTDPYDCNCYFWKFAPGEFALFDAGSGRDIPAMLDHITEAGARVEQIRFIFLTHHHADHIGGAARLRELSGAKVIASPYSGAIISTADEEKMGLRAARSAGGYPLDYTVQPCPVDIFANEGDVFTMGHHTITVLSTPGHCQGALSYLVQCEEQRMLISGDVIFPGGTISLLYLPDCSLSDYGQTLAKLAEHPIDFLLPGHCDPQLSHAHESILLAHDQFQRLLIPPCYYH